MIQQIDLEQLIKDIETNIKNFIDGDTEELNISPPVHIPFIVGVIEYLFRQQGYEVDYDYNTHNNGRSIIYTILYNKQTDKTITLVLNQYILLHKGNLLEGEKEAIFIIYFAKNATAIAFGPTCVPMVLPIIYEGIKSVLPFQ